MTETLNESEGETVEELTIEDLRQMPVIDVWYYFQQRLIKQLCERICPHVEWTEWRCRGCLIRTLGENSDFYYENLWLSVLKHQVLYIRQFFADLILRTHKLHKNRFEARHEWEQDIWYIFDWKTDTRLPVEEEYYDDIQKKCKELNDRWTWTSKVSPV